MDPNQTGGQAPAATQPELVITITYRPQVPGFEGLFNVNGNVIHDRVLSYGMLDTAKDAIRKKIDESNASGIVLSGPIPGLDKMPPGTGVKR